MDDYSRACAVQLVDVSISGAREARFNNQLKDMRKLPGTMVMERSGDDHQGDTPLEQASAGKAALY